MKGKNHIAVLIAIFAIGVIGSGIWFIGQFTAVYPPIETYSLNYSTAEFETVLNKFSTDHDFSVTFTDTTALHLDKSKHNYYFKILDNQTSDKFSLKFKSDKSLFGGERIKLSLIGLHNEISNSVIYEPDEKSGEVKDKFEKTILVRIENYRQ
jgi:hypothetical protein